MAAKSFPSHLIHLPVLSPSPSSHYILCTSYSLFRSPWHSSLISLQTSKAYLYPVSVKLSRTIKCLPKSTEESEPETLASDGDDESGDDLEVGSDQNPVDAGRSEVLNGSRRIVVCSSDYPSHGIREPVYEVMEVQSNGMVSTRRINRRHLLKSSGLRPRDVRSVDPSLWLTNSMPSMLVVEAALNSQVQRLERRLMDLEPRVSMETYCYRMDLTMHRTWRGKLRFIIIHKWSIMELHGYTRENHMQAGSFDARTLRKKRLCYHV